MQCLPLRKPWGCMGHMGFVQLQLQQKLSGCQVYCTTRGLQGTLGAAPTGMCVLLSCTLCRWMAADLYLREVDILRFEVGTDAFNSHQAADLPCIASSFVTARYYTTHHQRCRDSLSAPHWLGLISSSKARTGLPHR